VPWRAVTLRDVSWRRFETRSLKGDEWWITIRSECTKGLRTTTFYLFTTTCSEKQVFATFWHSGKKTNTLTRFDLKNINNILNNTYCSYGKKWYQNHTLNVCLH
jgi:hypothetical protein